MASTGDAAKYATGLLNAAGAGADALTPSLTTLAATLGGHRELVSALDNPAVPLAARLQLAGTLVDRLAAPPLAAALANLLVRHCQFALLPGISALYPQLVAERKGIRRASVRLARAASPGEIEEIRKALTRVIGGELEIDSTVDPELIGGFVARVGDRVFDGSLARQLEQLRATFHVS